MWVATQTSGTCWSVSAWRVRRSPKPTRLRLSWTHVIVQLRRNRVGFGDLLTLQALTLQPVQEVCVATHIQLTGPFQPHSALTHKMGENSVDDSSTDLILDIIADYG